MLRGFISTSNNDPACVRMCVVWRCNTFSHVLRGFIYFLGNLYQKQINALNAKFCSKCL